MSRDDVEVVLALDTPRSTTSPRFTALQFILINGVVCGLEFCACAGFSYITPMLLKTGMSESSMSVVLGIGPLLGVFTVPIIGRLSDGCRSRYGRRRPFIFVFSLICIFSLIIIPYGEYISVYTFGQSAWSLRLGVVMLSVGTVLLDFSTQVCLTPCEALLTDLCRGTDQQDRAFTYYSFMCSFGGCIGYLVAAINWRSSSVGLYFGGQEQAAFSLLFGLFTFSMMSTLAVADETPVSQLSLPQQQQQLGDINTSRAPVLDPGYESGSNDYITQVPLDYKTDYFSSWKHKLKMRISGEAWSCPAMPLIMNLGKDMSAYLLHKLLPTSCSSLLRKVLDVPLVLRRLACTNFFSWSAVMCFNIFYTDFVGQAVFHGDPNAEDGSPARERYDDGIRYASWGLLFHCMLAACYAPFTEKLCERYSQRVTYLFGMSSFTIALLLMALFPTPVWCNLMAAMTGFAYATLTTIPFSLLSIYQEDKEFFYFDIAESSSLAERGVGTDAGILDTAYYMSQIVLLTFMGYFVDLTGSTVTYMAAASVLGSIACLFSGRIVYNRQQISLRAREQRHKTRQQRTQQAKLVHVRHL